MTNNTGDRLVALRNDNGGEYTSKEFQSFLIEKGIAHLLSVAYCPQQNGVAERMNRTLMVRALSMISHAGVPKCYWGEAVAAVAYITNRVPSAAIQGPTSPYEKWHEKRPNVSKFRMFGCAAYALIGTHERKKLNAKAVKLRFVGYDIKSCGYRLYDDGKNKIFVCRDVIFNEIDFKKDLMTSEPKNKKVAVGLSNDVSAENEDPQLDVNNDERVTQLRRSNLHIRLTLAVSEWQH